MDMEAFQEKMDQHHRSYFCRMLKMKVLPDCLLEQYARVKLLADRIDGFLSPGELALVVLFAGFDPDTGKFCVTEQPVEELEKQLAETTEGEDKRLQALADEHAVAAESVEQAEKETVEKKAAPVEAPTMTGEQAEKAVASGAAKVVGATGQAVEDTKDESTPDYGKDILWSPGMPVNVLQADELRQGRIVDVIRPGSGSSDPVKLTVEFEGGEGETVTVSEDEVEAI